MKYKTFKSLLLNLKDFHDLSVSSGASVLFKTSVNSCLNSISKDFGDDTQSTIEWLFESLITGEQGSIEFQGRTYDASIKNVYNLLRGRLNPQDARVIEVDISKEVDNAINLSNEDELLRAYGVKR